MRIFEGVLIIGGGLVFIFIIVVGVFKLLGTKNLKSNNTDHYKQEAWWQSEGTRNGDKL